jgi:hypothetical protein
MRAPAVRHWGRCPDTGVTYWMVVDTGQEISVRSLDQAFPTRCPNDIYSSPSPYTKHLIAFAPVLVGRPSSAQLRWTVPEDLSAGLVSQIIIRMSSYN